MDEINEPPSFGKDYINIMSFVTHIPKRTDEYIILPGRIIFNRINYRRITVETIESGVFIIKETDYVKLSSVADGLKRQTINLTSESSRTNNQKMLQNQSFCVRQIP